MINSILKLKQLSVLCFLVLFSFNSAFCQGTSLDGNTSSLSYQELLDDERIPNPRIAEGSGAAAAAAVDERSLENKGNLTTNGNIVINQMQNRLEFINSIEQWFTLVEGLSNGTVTPEVYAFRSELLKAGIRESSSINVSFDRPPTQSEFNALRSSIFNNRLTQEEVDLINNYATRLEFQADNSDVHFDDDNMDLEGRDF